MWIMRASNAEVWPERHSFVVFSSQVKEFSTLLHARDHSQMFPACSNRLRSTTTSTSSIRGNATDADESTPIMAASTDAEVFASWQEFLFGTFPARLPQLWSKYFKAVGRQQIARLHSWTCVRETLACQTQRKMMWRCVTLFLTNNRCNKVCDTVSRSGFISWYFSLIWKQPLFVRPVKFTVTESGERKWWESSESNCWHDDCARERIIMWIFAFNSVINRGPFPSANTHTYTHSDTHTLLGTKRFKFLRRQGHVFRAEGWGVRLSRYHVQGFFQWTLSDGIVVGPEERTCTQG